MLPLFERLRSQYKPHVSDIRDVRDDDIIGTALENNCDVEVKTLLAPVRKQVTIACMGNGIMYEREKHGYWIDVKNRKGSEEVLGEPENVYMLLTTPYDKKREAVKRYIEYIEDTHKCTSDRVEENEMPVIRKKYTVLGFECKPANDVELQSMVKEVIVSGPILVKKMIEGI